MGVKNRHTRCWIQQIWQIGNTLNLECTIVLAVKYTIVQWTKGDGRWVKTLYNNFECDSPSVKNANDVGACKAPYIWASHVTQIGASLEAKD